MTARIAIAMVGLVLSQLAGPGAAQTVSLYAGEETREIKALASKDIRDLLDGRGMGLAKPAELNGYPGPMHALELAEPLKLSAAQRDGLEAVRARMGERAKLLGAEIVALERELDVSFAQRRVDEPRLRDLTARIGEKQGALRAVHLAAHIETAALLSAVQIADYDRLRGYGAAPVSPSHHQAGGKH